MKFAVFGDIHGNLEALKAAYEAALAEKVERMYHMGDLGGYAPFINEVVDFLVGHGVEGVQGNYDETVALDKEHCGCRYENQLQADMMDAGFNWTKAHASSKTIEYLRSLPREIFFTAGGLAVKLFHATPAKNNLYWTEDRDDRFFREMAYKSGADLMIYGHTHKPYRRELDGKVFINAGSVGKPKDGDTRACLTVIDIDGGKVQSSFVRVPYDLEKTATAIIESGMPAYFAERLREGK